MEPAIAQVLTEEAEESLLAKADMQVRKAQNMLEHHDEIMSRAPRQWIVSEHDRKTAKGARRGRVACAGES
jgi:ATP-dependent RNA helicase DDX27